MTEPDLPPLDDDVRALLEQSARIEPAPVASKTRVLARLEDFVKPTGGGGGQGNGAPRPPAARSTFPRGTASAVSFVLGGVVGALVMRSATPAPAGPPGAVYVETADPPATAQPSAKAAPAPVENLPLAGCSGTSWPSAQTASTPARVGGSPASEQALLDAARTALEHEDGPSAMAAVAQHERKYPAGSLVQEREAIAVRALVLVGRVRDARIRADRFRERFPNSVLLPAIQSTLEAAPPP